MLRKAARNAGFEDPEGKVNLARERFLGAATQSVSVRVMSVV